MCVQNYTKKYFEKIWMKFLSLQIFLFYQCIKHQCINATNNTTHKNLNKSVNGKWKIYNGLKNEITYWILSRSTRNIY